MPFFSLQIGLLGIDTGHMQTTNSVKDKRTGSAVDDNWQVRQNSGVAIVAPFWKIKDILQGDEFLSQRSGKRFNMSGTSRVNHESRSHAGGRIPPSDSSGWAVKA